MACNACGAENSPGQRFCHDCGRPLEAPLTRHPREYTPAHLAEKIFAAGRALDGERKQVTVLFTDVKGSMELAERVDAEAWRSIMDRYFALVCDGVHRYEGTVDKFTGDGAMALFGAPIAHEDHARRACAAALDLQEALAAFGEEVASRHGLEFAVRLASTPVRWSSAPWATTSRDACPRPWPRSTPGWR